jgi:hypothetical protein
MAGVLLPPGRPPMNCRIDRVVSAESDVVLLVSGQITGAHVETLRSVLEQEPGGFVNRPECSRHRLARGGELAFLHNFTGWVQQAIATHLVP